MKPSTFPKRKSLRLQDYDYSQEGAYFITICCQNKQHLFGKIQNSELRLNRLGELVQAHWVDLPTHFSLVSLDAFVIMPNHFHGIVVISDVPVGAASMPSESLHLNTKSTSLGTIVGTYKAAVSRHACTLGLAETSIWQRGYHDHIIRNEKSLNYIRSYVASNAERWANDSLFS